MTAIQFACILNEIRKNAQEFTKNPDVWIVMDFLQSHGGYSASSAEIKVPINNITFDKETEFLKIMLVPSGENKIQIASILNPPVNHSAYLYVPLSEIKCIYLIK